jgi:hypothetical protein
MKITASSGIDYETKSIKTVTLISQLMELVKK